MKRLLVANRGEIARRIIRSAHALGIATVAVYSDEDADALHVREASSAFALGGATAAQSYLRIDRLITAARATGADAVHPGYGFLSENADFAQAVIDAGLVWVGPPPAAIRALGSKSAIKARAAELGVPCLPGYAGRDQSVERFTQEAERIGVPLMVKAAAGGGGRGMRLLTHADQLADALRSARSEAEAAFGDGELLIERALLAPRHVEIQVFADAHGHCIHLGERDCSVQRRHQKIIEESPSPALDVELRERMGAAAVRLAQTAGYVGAGTVEFLLEGRSFYLMEMNTRLQVEHPVTEALTGIDLVAWQLRVARGEPLPLTQAQVRFECHAIEVRLCAEDEQFAPHAGRVQRVVLPAGVRVDHALEDGATVSPHYDSMLGKLIAHAPTRDAAIDQLVNALAHSVVLGLPTNRAMLIACLQDAVFRAGDACIPFLAERGDALRATLIEREASLRPLMAAAVWWAQGPGSASREETAPAARAPAHGGLAAPFSRPMRLRHRGQAIDAALQELSPRRLAVTTGDARAVVEVDARAGTLCDDGRVHALHAVRRGANEWHLQIDGIDAWVTDASYDPPADVNANAATQLLAPFSGRVVALRASPGQRVAAGETLVVIESMKLEHAVTSPRDAVVADVAVTLGQQLAPQQPLLRFEPAAARAVSLREDTP